MIAMMLIDCTKGGHLFKRMHDVQIVVNDNGLMTVTIITEEYEKVIFNDVKKIQYVY